MTEVDPSADGDRQNTDDSTAAAANLCAAALAEANRCKDALTGAEALAVDNALNTPAQRVVAELEADGTIFTVHGEHAARHRPEEWLSESTVNFRMALLQDRDNRRCKADSTLKPCHFFNSFFIAKLMGPDAQSYS